MTSALTSEAIEIQVKLVCWAVCGGLQVAREVIILQEVGFGFRTRSVLTMQANHTAALGLDFSLLSLQSRSLEERRLSFIQLECG